MHIKDFDQMGRMFRQLVLEIIGKLLLQELLSAFRVVHYRWRSRKVIQMILSNACIINITLCGHSGDIEKLIIDKSLVGKLSGETVSDGKSGFVRKYEPRHDKTNKMAVRPAKTQISLGIRPD